MMASSAEGKEGNGPEVGKTREELSCLWGAVVKGADSTSRWPECTSQLRLNTKNTTHKGKGGVSDLIHI